MKDAVLLRASEKLSLRQWFCSELILIANKLFLWSCSIKILVYRALFLFCAIYFQVLFASWSCGQVDSSRKRKY